jgi:C4-dicarboxylate-specific signal transduction histidine kinase
MSESHLCPLHEGGVAFFGAIGASLSHELNNVFATINELAGLLQDLAEAGERREPPSPARLKHLAARITAQVERGQQLSKQRNRLAHCVDSRWSQIDAGGVAEETVALCGRFARLRKVSLKCSVPESPVTVHSDPFQLRHALWRCLEVALCSTQAGGSVHLEVSATADEVRLRVSGSSAAQAESEVAEKANQLALLVEALGGRLDFGLWAGDHPRLVVVLPQSRGAQGADGSAAPRSLPVS